MMKPVAKGAVAAAVAMMALAASASAAPILVDFESPADVSLFPGGGVSFLPQTLTADGRNIGRLQTGNGPAARTYTPDGTAYLMGAETLSTDIRLVVDGRYKSAQYSGGLMLQQGSTGYYRAYLKAEGSTGLVKLIVGHTSSGHSSAITTTVGTFDNSDTGSWIDVGWYNISAAVSVDGIDNYKAVVTVTDPLGNTNTATYIDTGTARYTTPGAVGYFGYSQWSKPVDVDNFKIVPEPATLVLALALIPALRLRRRG